MKKTLALITRNEVPMLTRTLPVMAPLFDEILAVDACSTDGTQDLLRSFGATVVSRPWSDDYAAARNRAIQDVTGEAIFMFDADEAVFPDGLKAAVLGLEHHPAVVLPRIEFVFDLDHYNPDIGPDLQARFFRRDAVPRFAGRVHETLVILGGERAFETGHRVDACQIYHYGQTKPLAETVLRHYNYGRIQSGLQPVIVLPSDVPLVLHHRKVAFPGPHPLRK